MEWESGTCHTNGIDIHYTRTRGGGTPIVLLHGLMANGPCFRSELASLCPQLQTAPIPDATHALHLSQPERFSAVVREFLDGLGAQS